MLPELTSLDVHRSRRSAIRKKKAPGTKSRLIVLEGDRKSSRASKEVAPQAWRSWQSVRLPSAETRREQVATDPLGHGCQRGTATGQGGEAAASALDNPGGASGRGAEGRGSGSVRAPLERRRYPEDLGETSSRWPSTSPRYAARPTHDAALGARRSRTSSRGPVRVARSAPIITSSP